MDYTFEDISNLEFTLQDVICFVYLIISAIVTLFLGYKFFAYCDMVNDDIDDISQENEDNDLNSRKTLLQKKIILRLRIPYLASDNGFVLFY